MKTGGGGIRAPRAPRGGVLAAPLSFPLSFLFAAPGSPGFAVSLQPGLGNKTSGRRCEVMEDAGNEDARVLGKG